MAQGERHPVMLCAQDPVQTGVQASLRDLPSQLQNHRAAPLVLLLEHRGTAWLVCFIPSTSHSSELGVSWGWASLLSCPAVALLLAPFAGSWLHTVLVCDCSKGDSPERSRHREFCLPWSSVCPGTPGGVAALEQPCSQGCDASFKAHYTGQGCAVLWSHSSRGWQLLRAVPTTLPCTTAQPHPGGSRFTCLQAEQLCSCICTREATCSILEKCCGIASASITLPFLKIKSWVPLLTVTAMALCSCCFSSGAVQHASARCYLYLLSMALGWSLWWITWETHFNNEIQNNSTLDYMDV